MDMTNRPFRSVFNMESPDEINDYFASCMVDEDAIISCQGCDDEVLVKGDTCPACRTATAERLDAENAARIAAQFPVMRMTTRGAFVQIKDGSWVRR